MAYIRKADRDTSEEAIGKRLAELRKKINDPKYMEKAVNNLAEMMADELQDNWRHSVWRKKKK